MDTTEMPKIEQDPYLKEHQTADRFENAHPIDADIVLRVCGDNKMDSILLHAVLSAVQAVASTEVLQNLGDNEQTVQAYGGVHYIVCNSVTFYDIASFVDQKYNQSIQVERIEKIVDAHTIQFLQDVHGYDGEFGGETARDGVHYDETISNAMNDPSPYEGTIDLNEMEYGIYTDSRGLVVEEGTHAE